MARLEIAGLTKRYGDVTALRDLTLDVDDGELLMVVGPSGSGKTTTLRLVAGLERPSAGTVTLDGRAVTDLPPPDRKVGMVFQSHALFPHMTVEENLAFGLVARKRPRDEIVTRVTQVADALGIGGLLGRRPVEISGGERQRVALGRAMLREPDIFLMDEPLASLDAQLRTQTRTEIARLQAQLGVTTLYVTHDQAEAMSIGHRIAVLRDGALQQVGSPTDLYDRPVNLFVARFLGSPPMNVLPARITSSGEIEWAGGALALPRPLGTERDALLGVRPEHVHVHGSRWSRGIQPSASLNASVVLAEPMGDQVLLAVDAAGSAIVARVEPAFHPHPGEQVEIWPDPNRVHVFDPITETSLLHPGAAT